MRHFVETTFVKSSYDIRNGAFSLDVSAIKNIYLVEPSQRTIFSYVLVLIQRNYQES